jgi:hypothetical protein
MDPNLQRILDEIKTVKAAVDGVDSRVGAVEVSLGSRISAMDRSISDRFGRVEDAVQVFDEWRPTIDKSVQELRDEIGTLRQQKGTIEKMREEMTALRKTVSRAVLDAAPATPAGILAQPVVTAPTTSVGHHPDVGPRVNTHHRGFESMTQLPVTGTLNPTPHPAPKPFHPVHRSLSNPELASDEFLFGGDVEGMHERHAQLGRQYPSSKLPKFNFPVFSGENPKLWISNCEDYFDMYSVEPHLWIKAATMNLSGATARWVQSLDHRGRRFSWPQFCKLVMDRFGKSQYEALIRQLFRIRQSSSVQEYIDKFSGLVDQLLAYTRNIDPLFFAMRIIDGLRDDIRTVVHMQHPSSFDEACVLALLQEEMLDSSRRMEGRRPENFPLNKFMGARNMVGPTLMGTSKPDKNDTAATSAGTERRGRGVEDRLNTLRSYRRARGLCIHCGEKWSRDHRCSENIQLHVLQEFWDICHNEDISDDSQPDENVADAQVLLAVSIAALNGTASAATMQFQGTAQGLPVQILLDSGSSHTFVSLHLSSKLTGQSPLAVPLRVKIADGQVLDCANTFLQLAWEVQGCSFHTDAKVLPLAHYDMVVGMDWLSQYSLMQVDWAQKWLVIPYEGAFRALQGELHSLPPGSIVQVNTVTDENSNSATSDRPPAIAQLLQEFQSVFEPPQGYPPERAFAHDIPLIPGATPVNVRPYRYPPAVKDEIERQITEMLNSGIVQRSQSPFSSSVLLVKKKMGHIAFVWIFGTSTPSRSNQSILYR